MQIQTILEVTGLLPWAAPFLMGVLTTAKNAKTPGRKLIGKKPPGWGQLRWVNSLPIRYDTLEGKVVLVRWFSDICEPCEASAPALNELYEEFHDRGFEIIGMYHAKPMRDVSADKVRDILSSYGFEFPVALDPHWDLLHEWWLEDEDREFTAPSFLINRNGNIRAVHPGHAICREDEANHEGCDDEALEDFVELRKKIQRLVRQ